MARGRKNPLHFGLPGRLKAAREGARKALSVDAGLAPQSVQEIEVEGRIPGIDTVEKLADTLRVSPSYLAYGEAHEWTPAPAPRHEGVKVRLEQLRLARGMGRKPLGKASGTSDTAVRTIENGAIPSVATVEKLAKGLKCSPGWLAFGEGPKPISEHSDGGTSGKGILLGLIGWFLHFGKIAK